MPKDEIALSLAGEEVVTLAERALLWPRAQTLFVADVHFGKDATFRRALRWVPPGTTKDDLSRLGHLVERYHVERLVILGDAFHSEHAGEAATFDEIARWREKVPAKVLMVEGNHDRRALDLALRLGFETVNERHALPPWTLSHHPTSPSSGYTLCGHLHPMVNARGAARQSMRVPCFWIGDHQCVLPAFGGFTGGSVVRPSHGDRVILVADGKVLDATTGVRGASRP